MKTDYFTEKQLTDLAKTANLLEERFLCLTFLWKHPTLLSCLLNVIQSRKNPLLWLNPYTEFKKMIHSSIVLKENYENILNVEMQRALYFNTSQITI